MTAVIEDRRQPRAERKRDNARAGLRAAPSGHAAAAPPSAAMK
jgi:hypothetical protein